MPTTTLDDATTLAELGAAVRAGGLGDVLRADAEQLLGRRRATRLRLELRVLAEDLGDPSLGALLDHGDELLARREDPELRDDLIASLRSYFELLARSGGGERRIRSRLLRPPGGTGPGRAAGVERAARAAPLQRAGRPPTTLPQQAPTDLRGWRRLLVARGLDALLDRPASTLLAEEDVERLDRLSPWADRPSVGDLLDRSGGYGQGRSYRHLCVATGAALWQLLLDVDAGRAARPALPASGEALPALLAPVAAGLRQLCVRLRESALPIRLAAPAAIRFACREDGNRLVVGPRAAGKQRRAFDRAAPMEIRLGPAAEDPVELGVASSWRLEEPEQILAFCEALLAVLYDSQLDPPTHATLVRHFETPAWQRTLEVADGLLAAVEAAALRQQRETLWWEVDAGDGVTAPTVRPLLDRVGKRGQRLKPKRLSWTKLAERPGLLRSEGDRLVADLVPVAAQLRRWSESRALVGQVFLALVDHPRVCLKTGEPPIPVPVRRVRVGLHVGLVDGRIELVPAIDGEPRDRAAFLEELELEGDNAGRLVEVRGGEVRVIGMTSVLRELLSEAEQRQLAIPVEGRAALVARLPRLADQMDLTVDADLSDQSVPAEPRLVLRLAAGAAAAAGAEDAALTATLLVRPLPRAPVFAPGDGPQEVLALTADDALVRAQRDLAAEQDLARRALGPWAERFGPEWDATFIKVEEALPFVAWAQDAAGLTGEWSGPQPAYRVEGRVDTTDLKVRLSRGKDWFGLAGEAELGAHRADLALLLAAVREGRRFVRLEGNRWLALEEQLVARLRRLEPLVFARRRGLEVSPAASALPDLFDDLGEAQLCAPWQDWQARFAAGQDLDPQPHPSLAEVLRPYQREGHAWLSRMATWGVGCCLADDMGLGKTLQAIAVLLDRSGTRPALVVAPTSVCANWQRELAKFAPSLTPVLHQGPDRAAALNDLGGDAVVIVSYAILIRDVEALAAIPFHTLVLDEAHAIKNPHTQRARAVRRIDAEWRLALTGTPVENHLGELWALFRAVAPGLLGGWEQFRQRYAVPIERHGDREAAADLARLLQPLVLRRSKAQVAPELPPRTHVDVDVVLSPAEAQLYDSAKAAAAAATRDAQVHASVAGAKARFQLLAALTRLRQLACHPKLFDPDSRLGSAKVERFLEMAQTLVEAGHRTLVFSQFVRLLTLVRAELDRAGLPYLYLDGSTPAAARAPLIDRFQRGEVPLFLISLKAGGLGLNLTAADNVIHLDPWWNPAVEDQATDRAHRIGQRAPVTIYRLISRGTIEEPIMALHREKRELVADVLAGADQAGGLSTDQLMTLLSSEEGRA